MTNVLMYSGGMDSYIISHVYDIDVFVFVRLGNEDNQRELDLLMTQEKMRGKVEVVDLPISQFELGNKILPFRNHMLAMIGAQFGAHVYFGFTGGDTTKDKDFVFKSQIEGMLNYFALDQHKVNHQEYPYTIEMPYKDSSKGEMVADFINFGNNPQLLIEESRSCYAGDSEECGTCRACLRKYVALKVNNVDMGDIFENSPVPHLIEFLEECKTKGRFQKEVDEVMAAIQGKVLY